MKGIRYYYLDNLRVLAMLGVVVFHIAYAYSPRSAGGWLSAEGDFSPFIDGPLWFSHLFRMPVFFAVTGFFSAYLFSKQGSWGMLRHRVLRIGLPFLLFVPLTTFLIMSGVTWAVDVLQLSHEALQLRYQRIMSGEWGYSNGSSYHLWFLEYLLVFCGALALLGKFPWQKTADIVSRIPVWLLLILTPLVLFIFLSRVYTPTPSPSTLMPQLWAIGFFGVYFFLGVILFYAQALVTRMASWCWILMSASVGMYILLGWLVAAGDSTVESLTQTMLVVVKTLEAYIGFWMTIACLGAAKRYLDRDIWLVRQFVRPSYWIYLIHLPIVLAIQYVLIRENWGVGIEFLVTFMLVMLIGMVSYRYVVATTPISWLLYGRTLERKPAIMTG
jgi:glucan biosynthesis protein C